MKQCRDLLSLNDLTAAEINNIFNLATQIKNDPMHSSELLKGRSIGLVFQKPSNRTRVSFEVGINQMSGNCIYLGPDEINLGVRESTADVSKTLSRYLNGIVARTNTHEDIMALSKNADIPIINGLSDLYHPCQGLTDLFSIREVFHSLENISIAYVGDGNNVCHSLILGAAKIGISVHVATPPGYEPNEEIVQKAQAEAQETGASIKVSNQPDEAVFDSNVVYADVWVSMGQEDEAQQRLEIFKDFQINEQLVSKAKSNYIFMHCLPAHRGEEVTADVIDGEHSIVFDQAENRLHIQKAILNFLFNTW